MRAGCEVYSFDQIEQVTPSLSKTKLLQWGECILSGIYQSKPNCHAARQRGLAILSIELKGAFQPQTKEMKMDLSYSRDTKKL